ncbi:DEAD/DEAH box helicase [Synechococcus sp. HB1133]|uniref:DEAD/DEAH box helicase n=1 Tax=unclassified Synechococcus TaxID=2626047 RepID=UPI00140CF36D|nr:MULTISPECIES: DEAD/DEAH box helicase [unclassified Synechococcus]MCB4394210.1 DEAD/DEAH box helicase [Synechococcus sp. PH41509]MCB4423419.1 DEAD/DEAH box helicase [Synechococcus sp. HB1133]MCB4431470.1 DEAD/DEAH box helicase [Synechococcus sp. HBA1120]NHI82367.1 DEAD/DEAH box helicase [Synechococcus sp. HB1133]
MNQSTPATPSSEPDVDRSAALNPSEIFPFPLDDFQLEAMDALNQGHSVVVSAPTGSGKTLIGEYAIHRALAHGQKVFYTTPLKALSNQKLRDFRAQFGVENVGLMTGDLSMNREASIVVMTTEIFRNMLYAEADEHDDPLADVEAVVLDECHYMNDSQRGTVWEESIIHCPPPVQLVALSATVANAGQLTDWIEKVHGPTTLVMSDHRPVPLQFSFCSAKGLHPLLNDAGTGLHPNCKVWRAPKGHKRKGRSQRPPQPEPPPISFVVAQMAERQMLPAIYFIFSRRGCDKAVRDLGVQCLVTKEEQARIKARLTAYSDVNPEAVRDGIHADALLRGIAAHHAGVLPAWKELIEELFQQGLVKVVFATETLAAGINMPARSTVIAAMSKRTERGHRPLMGSEFLQMAGRAGRRGLDSQGYVVTVQSRFEGVREAGQLATSPADPLVSQFTPSYGMVLNLLQRHDLAKARELVERSFGRYLAGLDLVEDEDNLSQLRLQLSQLEGVAGDIPWEDFEDYEKMRGRLREERRLLRILQQQAEETLANELTMALQFASTGTLVSLKSPQLRGRVAPAVIVEKVKGPGQFPLLLCLTDDNVWILLPCQAVVSIHAELSCLQVDGLALPELTRSGELRHGDQASGGLALAVAHMARRHDMTTPQYDLAGEVLTQARLVRDLEQEQEQHPAHRWGDRKQLKKHRRRMEDLELEIAERQRVLHQRANRHWETFLALMDILQQFGCLDELDPTEIGRTVAALRGDNELWLGLALMSGHLDDLSPPDLAAVFEAISTEVNRPDLWSGFPPPAAAEEALQDLSGLRRELLRAQERAGVVVPAWWEPELMGLVDAWARGTTWSDLIANTSLDEGDVVRIMRRTVDLLAQVPYCEAISEQLRSHARQALKAINRFPVAEAEDLVPSSAALNPATERAA